MFITPALINQVKNCYDIRSTKITDTDAFLLGQAFGSYLIDKKKSCVAVGYDRRLNSEALQNHFIDGLVTAGVNAISIGRATTPMVQIAETLLECDAAVSITASHNPPEYHGFKFFVDSKSFADVSLSALVSSILEKKLHKADVPGTVTNQLFYKIYSDHLQKNFSLSGKFRIGWDFVNGTAADVFPYLMPLFQGEHFITNHTLDPEFGGHAPDPTYEPRLEELKTLINEKYLDFGIAIDGDCDRCIVFDSSGKIVPGDTLLALFAYFAHHELERNIKLVWDVKSSNALIQWTKKFADSTVSVSGHSNITNALYKTSGDIGGETSGHYMFKEYDYINDGFFSAFKLISCLEKFELTLQKALECIPKSWLFEAEPIRLPENFKPEDKARILNQIENSLTRSGITMDKTDGIKACYSYGWWLIRPSRTEQIFRVSGEGWTEQGLENIKEHLKTILSLIVIEK